MSEKHVESKTLRAEVNSAALTYTRLKNVPTCLASVSKCLLLLVLFVFYKAYSVYFYDFTRGFLSKNKQGINKTVLLNQKSSRFILHPSIEPQQFSSFLLPPLKISLEPSKFCHGCRFATGVFPLLIAAPVPRLLISRACCRCLSAPVVAAGLPPVSSHLIALPASHS